MLTPVRTECWITHIEWDGSGPTYHGPFDTRQDAWLFGHHVADVETGCVGYDVGRLEPVPGPGDE